MVETYAKTANEIRKTVLSMIYKAQVSHVGSNFSCIDILTVLYNKIDPNKDKLVVSKGWVAASVYALNVKYGYMPQEAIDKFCDGTSPYIGLIEPIGYFACETASGSMGLGLPSAVGIALAKKLKGEEGKVYVLMSDGELQIGTTWECVQIAAQYKLNNLTVLIDKNGYQAMGKTEDIVNTYFPCGGHWDYSFPDGHDFKQLENALREDWVRYPEKPRVITCKTIKGKGVPEWENNNLWHYAQIKEEDYNYALSCLK